MLIVRIERSERVGSNNGSDAHIHPTAVNFLTACDDRRRPRPVRIPPIVGATAVCNQDVWLPCCTVSGAYLLMLGVLPGDYFGHANAINDRGQIVGWSSGETTSTRAFVWDKGVTSEPGPRNGSFSMAVDINKHGLIVGTGDDNGTRPPVMWSRDGVTALPLLPGAYSGEAGRVNDRGIVVGRMVYYPSEIVVPVMWVDGLVVELPSLPVPPNYTNWPRLTM